MDFFLKEPLLDQAKKLEMQEIEDDFRSKIELFSSDQSPEYETVDILPKPGMVLKTLVKTSMETNKYPSNMKFFINMCYSDKIPKPTCTSEEELRKAMNGDADAIYRVPNVLNDIKFDKDAAQKKCLVCDFIVNNEVYQRILKDYDFKLYVSEVAVELIEEKNMIELGREYTFPKMHYKGIIESRTVKIPKKKFSLITEISKPIKDPTNKVNDNKIKDNNDEDDTSNVQKPGYIITEHDANNINYLLIAIEISSLELIEKTIVDIEPSRLFVNSSGKYILNLPLPYVVDINTAKAKFVNSKKRLFVKVEKKKFE
ncbi:21873_t:CDS:2 [Entrophospora sp. SA101]|nr:5925_t:CDS:2 [Entrophospora sp. SA101]CAJ0639764.1 6210_t:CDS:2 [Entrophospora sp. SA101]CAJ0763653.1 2844_t:CDS:2 [Entrophospora sp. SA101]CAJ0769049.1 21873_t:CDS:2 [Entrophospora sp. SA101]CAJ0827448.1 2864_t:CDS:2 [Entrophospora sp. SA101]